MDGKKMTYADGQFDCIIDKACLDSMLCGENSAPNSKLVLDEIYRVLSANGVYICVSYGLPEMRLSYFNKYDWKTTIQKVTKPTVSVKTVIDADVKDKQEAENFHFIYILKKEGPEPVPKEPEE
tara:strand:+ start:351 stop:722 length:372 start_codon:yes stop_codon:yes gene_type:complete